MSTVVHFLFVGLCLKACVAVVTNRPGRGLTEFPTDIPNNHWFILLNDNLIKEVPVEISSKWTDLQVLQMNNNQLTKIPEMNCCYTTLTQMNVRDNRINCVKKEDVAKFIKLELLHLENNQIRHFPDDLKLPNSLERLGMSKNLLTKFPSQHYWGGVTLDLKLDGNPLVCDETFTWFLVPNSKIILQMSPEPCIGGPNNMKQMKFTDITTEMVESKREKYFGSGIENMTKNATILAEMTAPSVHGCLAKCMDEASCIGVNYNTTVDLYPDLHRCELVTGCGDLIDVNGIIYYAN